MTLGFIIFWLICAIVVAVAAEARGRNGFGWLVLAVFISPLLALILVLVIPNLKQEKMLAAIAEAGNRRTSPPGLPPALPKPPFEPDGVYAGVPYRVADDGSIDAIMQGSMVRFRDFDKFTGALRQST
jgi:hypothetical protein